MREEFGGVKRLNRFNKITILNVMSCLRLIIIIVCGCPMTLKALNPAEFLSSTAVVAMLPDATNERLAIIVLLLLVLALALWVLMLFRKVRKFMYYGLKQRDKANRFRRLLDMMPIPLAYVSGHGEVIFYNQCFTRILGYRKDEVKSIAQWWELAYPDPEYRAQVMDAWNQLVRQATVEGTDVEAREYEVTCKNGEQRTMSIGGIPVGEDFLAVIFDLTELKHEQAALIESDRRLKEAQRLAQLGHWIWDIKTGKIEMSDEVYQIFHRAPETFMPTVESILEMSPWPEERNRGQELLEATSKSHDKGTFEQRFLFPDNTIGCFQSTYQGRYDEEGNVVSIVGTAMDITDMKRAEEERQKLENQLRHSQKMESIGRLAGGVAHDFNNMLGVILGRAEIALKRLDHAHPVCRDLEDICRAAERSADLTRQLLAFARKQTIAPKVLKLNTTVEGMLKMLQRLIGENIELKWAPGADLGCIKMDPSQIDQILANLCVNARDAIRDVGVISIGTDMRTFDVDYCNHHEGITPGKYILLTVSDSGSGMDQETMSHVFEPFYTTKAVGKGTGLGLATVYGIVRQNNGFINVYSELGHGTTFSICLPHYDGTDKPIDDKIIVPETVSDKDNETILLVEDEHSLLIITADMLETQGYHVLSANSTDDAVRIAAENAGRIDLLLADVIMPGMNGQELARQLAAICPEMKCLFMSGYTSDVIAPHGVLEEGVFFIQKPFSLPDLVRKVREVIHYVDGT